MDHELWCVKCKEPMLEINNETLNRRKAVYPSLYCFESILECRCGFFFHAPKKWLAPIKFEDHEFASAVSAKHCFKSPTTS